MSVGSHVATSLLSAEMFSCVLSTHEFHPYDATLIMLSFFDDAGIFFL